MTLLRFGTVRMDTGFGCGHRCVIWWPRQRYVSLRLWGYRWLSLEWRGGVMAFNNDVKAARNAERAARKSAQ